MQTKLSKELSAANEFSTTDLLSWSFAKFHPRLALACSFQAEGSVLIDLVHRLRGSDFRVFTLDTGRLNQETYECMEAIRARYGIEIEVFFPDATQVEDMVRQHGMNLFYDSIEKRKLCCGIRKVEPLKRAVEVERSFHASFGKSLGMSREQLDRATKGPVTEAYIAHLQSVARSGTLSELVAAVLPCYWIYGEVGRRLYKGRPRQPKIYRQWIETYAGEAFWRPVREQIGLMDKLGAAANRAEKNRMNANFILSSRYEFMFWEQAYRM